MLRFLKRVTAPTVLFLWTVYYFADVWSKDAKTGALIKPVSIAVFALYAIIMTGEFKTWRASRDTKQSEEEAQQSRKKFLNLVICTAAASIYILIMDYVGFILSTTIFLIAFFFYVKVEKRMLACIASVVFSVVIYLLFGKLLSVPLPVSIFGF